MSVEFQFHLLEKKAKKPQTKQRNNGYK